MLSSFEPLRVYMDFANRWSARLGIKSQLHAVQVENAALAGGVELVIAIRMTTALDKLEVLLRQPASEFLVTDEVL
jgi:hypothetical protein